MDDWVTPFINSELWLRARCIKQARTRPGLEVEDLVQEVGTRYFETAEAWFAQDDTRDPLARCRSLLSYRLLNVVTEHDREMAKRELERLGPEEEEAPTPRIDRIPSPEPDAENVLRAKEIEGFIDEVPNATYRLAFRSIYQRGRTEEGDFTAARKAILRPVSQAWSMYATERLAPHVKESPWKRIVAQVIRCTGPLRPPVAENEKEIDDIKTARSWLEKNLQRARAAILARMGEAA
jgi:hypothetical protein